jgi:hypothetical protein
MKSYKGAPSSLKSSTKAPNRKKTSSNDFTTNPRSQSSLLKSNSHLPLSTRFKQSLTGFIKNTIAECKREPT